MELSKYELARIIGARALQLARGAPPVVKVKKGTSFIEVAEIELEEKAIPLSVMKTAG